MSATTTQDDIELRSRADSSVAGDAIALNQQVDQDFVEGGYGWIVVICGATLSWIAIGSTYSFGILLSSLTEEGVASSSTLAFVGSTMVSCVAIFAILNARLVRALGGQRMAGIGVALLGGGQILSSWSKANIGALFLTEGLVSGMGISFLFLCMTVVPSQWFRKRRGLSNGIVYAGGGLGGAFLALTLDRLVSRVGTAWTFRIQGLFTLAVGAPAAYFLREKNPVRTGTFVDWRLFRDGRFLVLFLTGAIGTFPLFVPPFFLPLYATSLGLSGSTGAALVAGFNFASAIGRIGFGQACDMIGPVNSLFVALALCAVSMLAIWPASQSLGPLILFVIINGAANGAFFSVVPSVVASVFGPARMAVATGMVVTGWVGGYLLGAPIAGYLLDAYGGSEAGLEAYRPAIFYAGSLASGATGLVLLLRLRMDTSLWKKL